MSGLVGRGSRSFKKKIVEQSLIPALGIKKVRFAHQNGMSALAANATIQFSIFTAPAEMTALGFSNPSSTEITNLRIGEFRNNVIVESNLNGVLIDQLAYTITNSAITFINDYVVDANEIFILNIGSNPVTGNRIVDARPLRASGGRDGENMFADISARPIDFSTGQGFRVASSTVNSDGEDNQQIGNVQVFVNGVLQIRNDGNSVTETTMPATDQSGNYAEVALTSTGTLIEGVDYANAIRFNQFNNYNTDDGVLVVATNLIVDEPNGTGLLSIVDNNSANILVNTTELATIPAASTGTVAQELRVNAGQTAYELYTPTSASLDTRIPTPGETVFSALINNPSNIPSIVSQTGDFIASVSSGGQGIVDFVWKTDLFSEGPVVTGTESANGPQIVTTSVPTTTGVTTRTFSRSGGTPVNASFSIIVQRQGTDYATARAITTRLGDLPTS